MAPWHESTKAEVHGSVLLYHPRAVLSGLLCSGWLPSLRCPAPENDPEPTEGCEKRRAGQGAPLPHHQVVTLHQSLLKRYLRTQVVMEIGVRPLPGALVCLHFNGYHFKTSGVCVPARGPAGNEAPAKTEPTVPLLPSLGAARCSAQEQEPSPGPEQISFSFQEGFQASRSAWQAGNCQHSGKGKLQ